MRVFHQLLANNLVANITNYTVWFALTFWVYLETRSVFATGMIGGIYLVLTAGLGFWFGSLVDHYRKKLVMLDSTAASFLLFGASFLAYGLSPQGSLKDVSAPQLWIFIVLVMMGVIAGNIRSIALGLRPGRSGRRPGDGPGVRLEGLSPAIGGLCRGRVERRRGKLT